MQTNMKGNRMSKTRFAGYLVVVAACLTTQAVSAQDALVVSPDSGAFPIGTPQNLSYGNGTLIVTGSLAGLSITNPAGASPTWRVSLRPVSGGQLALGCFERARRFGNPTRPEIDFSFASSGCNNAYGRYKILELQTGVGGAVTSLAVDFAQQCEGFGKATLGKVRFNSAVPTTGNFHEPVLNLAGNLSFVAAQGAVGASAPGGTGNITLGRVTTRPSTNFDNGVSVSYDGPLPGGSNGFWSLDFASPGDLPLVVADYPIATRYPFQAPAEAGLSFSYHGLGCNTSVGAFNVTNVRYDQLDPVVIDFAATFSQRCNNAQQPLTSGTISYNGNIIGPTSLYGDGVLFRSGLENGERPTFFSATCQ